MNKFPVKAIFSLIFLLMLVAALVTGFRDAGAVQAAEAKRTLEDSLRRAALSCYAIEGSYPDTLDYLTENYRVYVDEERFAVIYEVFASNIMPTITVLERQAAA